MSAGDVRVPTGADGRVASPCNSICRIDPASGWCVGCQRTIDEIARWGQMDEADRHRVWHVLFERRRQV